MSNFKMSGGKKKQVVATIFEPPTATTMEPTNSGTGKQVTKMRERDKAALGEQNDRPRKHKDDGGHGSMSKKGRSNPEIGRDENHTEPAPTSSQGSKQSRQPTVEEVSDDDDISISQQSFDGNGSRTMQEETTFSSQPSVEDAPGGLECVVHTCAHIGKLAARKHERNSSIYAFFENPKLVKERGRPAHEFKCHRRGCAATVRRFLDMKDVGSTGNLRKHA